MLHLLIGPGKGKTSAAAGMALRAAGRGLPVLFVQFLKDGASGEVTALRQVQGVTVRHLPFHCGFTWEMTEEERRKTAAACEALLEEAARSAAFLVVLDEALHALAADLMTRESLERVLNRPGETVLTGYAAPDWLKEKADYISCIEKEKHPFDRGVQARAGVEF